MAAYDQQRRHWSCSNGFRLRNSAASEAAIGSGAVLKPSILFCKGVAFVNGLEKYTTLSFLCVFVVSYFPGQRLWNIVWVWRSDVTGGWDQSPSSTRDWYEPDVNQNSS